MNNIPRKEMSINEVGASPVAGGVNTDWDKAQLQLGQYSIAENVREHGPGFKMRPGLVRHNTTDFGTCLSMFSYKKGEKFYAQLDTGDVHEATNAPPATTTGAFGTLVLDESGLNDESTGTILPGSWSTFKDNIIFSQGKIQHAVKPAISGRPRKVVFKKYTVDKRMLDGGLDITNDVTDIGSTKTSEDCVFTTANKDALFICTDFPATEFVFDLKDVAVGTITITMQFYDGDDWDSQTTGITDGTSGFSQDGTYVATMAGRETDGSEKPTVKFGRSGYWYRFSITSDEATETLTFNSIKYNGDFRLLENVPEELPGYIIEAAVESGDQYETYAASTVSLGLLQIGDYLYISTSMRPWAIYFDVGSTPNTTAAEPTVEIWTGEAYTAVSGLEDGTTGLFQTGYMSWDISPQVPEQRSFNDNKNYTYWTRIKFDAVLVAATVVSIQALYYHDINDYGRAGKVSCMWKDRGCFTFSRFDRDIYVSKKNRVNILNGEDFNILSPGDGRYNRTTAMLPFYNELMVFQKEEGSLGGCLTLFEGYSPSTYGKLVLSTRLGTFSQQSVCIVDASTDTTRTTDVTQTQVAFISKYGIFITDGRTIRRISGDIDDIYDPSKSNYININPGSGHWVCYDRASNCLRFGIQTIASTSSSPDLYPVFHLGGNYWTFDVFPYQSITAFAEVSAVSGSVDSLQYAAGKDISPGTTDLIYRCRSGIDYDEESDGTKNAIDIKLRSEFSSGGNYLEIKEFTVRAEAVTNYTMTKKVYENGVLDSTETETFDMDPDGATGSVFRERVLENVQLNSQFGLELTFGNTADPASWGTPPVIYDFIHNVNIIPNIN